jgi:excisionase family DNA binding protein
MPCPSATGDREHDSPPPDAAPAHDDKTPAPPSSTHRTHEPDDLVSQQLLFTTTQAAALLEVRASWLRKKTAAGLIPHTRLGRHVRFSQDDLAAIIRDGARTPNR